MARPLSPLLAPSARRRRGALERRRRALAAGTLAVFTVASLALAIGVPARPSFLVPAGRQAYPSWLAGPLAGLGPELTPATFSVLVVVLCVAYAGALALADAVQTRWALAAIVVAHVAFALTTPILSADVFGYIGYARLGAVHGLDPYTHAANAAPLDPVHPFVGWKGLASPYGPLFTLATYPLAALGVPAALWTLKVIVALAGLAGAGLVASLAARLGRDPVPGALFVGLNPVALVWGVGGAHNDALVTLLVLGAISLVLRERERAGAGLLVAAAAVKATAGLLLPFLLVGARRRGAALIGAALTAIALGAVAIVAFGWGVLGYLDVLGDQGSFVSLHAIPHELARGLGLAGVDAQGRYTLAPAVRVVAGAVLVVAVAVLLARAWRGMDWITAAGWATLALLVTSTFLLPWYVVWLLPLAALAEGWRLRAATLALCAFIVVTRLPALAA